MAVASAQLFAGIIPSGGALTSVYRVPAARVTILKSLNVVAQGEPETGVSIYLRSRAVDMLFVLQALELNVPIYREVWLVLEAGDEIMVAANVPNIVMWFSGSELEPLS